VKGAASDRAALAKQAEGMCIRREFAEAEAVYVGLLDGAGDSEERFGIARRLAAVLAAQDDKQALAKAAVEGILSDYADNARPNSPTAATIRYNLLLFIARPSLGTWQKGWRSLAHCLSPHS